jgi:hypothetical protein
MSANAHISYWQAKVDQWITTRGPLDTIARIKGIRLHVTRFLSGEPLMNPSHPSLALDKSGLPSCLGPLKDLARSEDPNALRLLHTLLRVSTMINVLGIVDFTPVTSPSTGTIKPQLKEDFTYVLNQLEWQLEVSPWTDFHLTTKAGPNGLALLSSLTDLHLLPDWLIKSIGVLGGEDLVARMDLLRESIPLGKWESFFKIRPSSLIRKLSIIHDPEAKERVIAILDYWSQTALRPLHQAEFRLLKRIQGDCTFNQGDFTRWLPASGPYHSLDLTSATDRFPAELQRHVLEQLIGKEKADAWLQIMVKEPFHYQGEQYSYAVGQPMGAYSSWATFAITHHLLVRVAAMRAGFSPHWHSYALLGDDIVIADDKVAENYKLIMSELGVAISPHKTHVSKDTYEFAKRWMHRGVEITGPRINGFTERRYYLLAENLRQFLSGWFDPRDVMAVPGLAPLLSILKIPIRGSKIQQLLLMPRRVDRGLEGSERIRRFLVCFYGSYLGCNRQVGFQEGFTFQTLAEVKTHFIEARLKANFQKAQPFLRKIGKLAVDLGLEDHSILRLTPPVQCVIANINELQADFDRLRSAYWDSDEDIVFNKVIHNGIDPERVLSVRSSHLILQTNAALVNQYKGWAVAYMNTRDEELSSSSGDSDRASGTYWSSLDDQ